MMGWLGWKDNSHHFLFCGCATGAVDGCLYILGGFALDSPMAGVLKYDLVSNSWSKENPMSIGRDYCETRELNNKLFFVGVFRREHGLLTSLYSAEVYDPQTGLWSDLPSISFSKAHMLELHILLGLFFWPYYFDQAGEVYDPETNSWVDMPIGMSDGLHVVGAKFSVNVDGNLYALDL
ncbi:hypothetical protein R6Q57_006263 [Mikania cordata]